MPRHLLPARDRGIGFLLPQVLVLMALHTAATAQPDAGQDPAKDPLRDYEIRRRYIVSHFDTLQKPGIYGAAVRYAGRRDIRTADSIFLASDHLRSPRGDMFWMFPVIGTYLFGKDVMSPAVRAAVRGAWKTYFPYRGDTENHWCMYYASLFLAAEQWPGLSGAEWFNGRSSAENRRESREYLFHWMRTTATIGQGEFDSPTYLPEYLISVSLLAEFSRDPVMKRHSRTMLDWLLADFATDHLDGMYIGGFSREGATSVFQPRSAPASEFAFLYFGTGDSVKSSWALLPALTSYRLPEIIRRIATDRSAPVLSRERKRVRNVIRFGAERNPPVYKTTYITRDYGLSSLQGGILQPIQQHTWSVRFPACKPFSTVFGLHPYWSGHELAMFFPEEEKVLVEDVASSKGTYNRHTKWTSSSPYERIFQHRNTLIALYDIDEGAESSHIDGFFPSCLDERITEASGWIVCSAGDTYIGWYPLQEAAWLRLPEDGGHHRLRSEHRQNGYVVEVRRAAECASFEHFRELLHDRIPRATLERGRVSARYVTIDGDAMAFEFPDGRVLNGAAVNLSATPLFESPRLRMLRPAVLELRHGDLRRVLDLSTLPRIE